MRTNQRIRAQHLLIGPAIGLVLGAAACRSGDGLDVGTGPSVVMLVGTDEPGQSLVISGTVFAPDGTTPVPGARLDVYQTDAEGYYTRPISTPRRARIRGSVWTDDEGRYEIRTVRPGHYPSQDEPAHVHVHVAAPGFPVHWIDSFLFADDPHLSPSDVEKNGGQGSFSAILELDEGEMSVQHGQRDIRLDPQITEQNRLVDGWYRGE